MDEILVTIGNLGFPIAITMYLLFRMESKMDALCETIQELTKQLIKLENN